MNITKMIVEKLPIPLKVKSGQTGQKRYYDDKLKGFGIRITSGGAKTFFVEKLIKGKLCRIKVGRFGEMTVEQARRSAQVMLGQIANGLDPVAEKKAEKMRRATLSMVMHDYLEARKSLKPKTLYDYKRLLFVAFQAWKDQPIINITKDKVERHHAKLGKEHGKAYANQAMRVLRALFNFASGKYEDSQGRSLVSENPVKRLSQARAWYRIERRRTYIKAHELSIWYQGLQQIENATLRDFILLIVFTGLRRQEGATLRWDQVDLKAKTLTINNTKNHEAHMLPLSDFVYELLFRRKQYASTIYVFPGTGETGYIIEPRKQIAKVIAYSGISFTIHDLRRTFITIAENLDIPAYALKRLLNHKMQNDVTAGYIMTDVERLRKPMELISDFLQKSMSIKQSIDIIELKSI